MPGLKQEEKVGVGKTWNRILGSRRPRFQIAEAPAVVRKVRDSWIISDASLSPLYITGPWVNQRIEGDIFFECIKQYACSHHSKRLLTIFDLRTTEAAKMLGIPFVERANDPDEPAFACVRLDRTIDRQMRRLSTFDAFLPPEVVKIRKQNLFICPQTIVCKIAVDRAMATGIYARSETASSTVPPTFLWAKREVIVCAGATFTPQLLMVRYVYPYHELGRAS